MIFFTLFLGGRSPGTENKTNMSNSWPRKWLIKKFEQRSLARELFKQYLTERQNGHLQSTHLWEGVETWSIGES